MFSELIFALLAIIFIAIDELFFAILLCSLTVIVACVLCYCYKFSLVLCKYDIVYFVSKVWIVVSCLITIFIHIKRLFKRAFSYKKTSKSFVECQDELFCGSVKSLESEIDTLVVKISQFYIHSWYAKISNDTCFPSFLRSTITKTLVMLCKDVVKLDKKKISYASIEIYLNFFLHFIKSLEDNKHFKLENFKMKHWALKDEITEWCYVQSLISSLVDKFRPPAVEQSLHNKECPVPHTVITEILTANLLLPLINLISNPAHVNSLIVKLFSNYFKLDEPINKISCIPKNISEEMPKNKMKQDILNMCGEDEFPNVLFISDTNGENSYVHEHENSVKHISDILMNVSNTCTSEELKLHYGMNLYANKLSANDKISPTKESFCDTTMQRSKSVDFISKMSELETFSEKSDLLSSRSNPQCYTPKPDASSSTNSVEQAEEATEIKIPLLFSDIKIIDTIQENDVGLLPYTVYVIQYSGLFHDAGSSDPSEIIKQDIFVKRRFREFHALQTKLENNIALRYYLKSIKRLNKGISLPFSNLDKKTISERKLFLEHYLKELCSYPIICESSELQEFLDYGGVEIDGFLRKITDCSIIRFDKILVRGVMKTCDVIKTALPLSSFDEDNLFSSSEMCEDFTSELKFQDHVLDYSSREPEIAEHIRNFMEKLTFEYNPEEWLDLEVRNTNKILRNALRDENTTSCNCPLSNDQNISEEENLFGTIIFDFIAVALKLGDVIAGDIFSAIKLSAFTTAKNLYSTTVNRLFIEALDNITEDHLSTWLHRLHTYLWPDVQDESITSTETYAYMETVMKYIKESCILNGDYCIKSTLMEVIHLFLLSVQNQEINKCLWYHVFDVIVVALCDKEKEPYKLDTFV